MTAPLRIVGTPSHRAELTRQGRELHLLFKEAQLRLDVIGSERKRVLSEMRTDGMTHTEIARATGMNRKQVLRTLGVRDLR